MRVVLASESPRRHMLCRLVGLEAVVVPPNVEEPPPHGFNGPDGYVLDLARMKALSVASSYPEDFVVAADTVVVIDGHILGKPKDEEDAVRILAALAGRTHVVYTGLALYEPFGHSLLLDLDRTAVTMKPMEEEEIRAYVATGEPLDKAGAYALQGRGACLVTRIEGDYSGVIGLPLPKLYGLMRKAGVDPLCFFSGKAAEGR